MREETATAVGDLKKCFSHIFHFWKQQYFNKSRSGMAVIVVKWNLSELFFFHKNYSNPPKKAGLIRENLSELFNIYIY